MMMMEEEELIENFLTIDFPWWRRILLASIINVFSNLIFPSCCVVMVMSYKPRKDLSNFFSSQQFHHGLIATCLTTSKKDNTIRLVVISLFLCYVLFSGHKHRSGCSLQPPEHANGPGNGPGKKINFSKNRAILVCRQCHNGDGIDSKTLIGIKYPTIGFCRRRLSAP